MSEEKSVELMIGQPHPEPADSDSIRQVRRRARKCYGLSELFKERDDLRGVSPAADFFADSVPWSA